MKQTPKAVTTKTKTTSGTAQRNTDLKNGGQSVTVGQTGETETETREEYAQRAPSSRRSAPASSSSSSGSSRMSDASGHRLMASAWMLGVGIISWQEVRDSHQMPVPKRLVGWSVAIGLLDLLGPIISFELGGVIAFGLVIGLFIRRGTKTAAPVNNPTANTAAIAERNIPAS